MPQSPTNTTYDDELCNIHPLRRCSHFNKVNSMLRGLRCNRYNIHFYYIIIIIKYRIENKLILFSIILNIK